MWRCPFDFSHLEKEEAGASLHHNSAHPDQGVFYRSHTSHGPHWYVLLLLDINKAGHTYVTKTTHPEQYDNSVHAQPPGASLSAAASTAAEGQGWHMALAISVGPSEAEADRIIDRISTSTNGKKQVRGGVQRGIRGGLASTWWNKDHFADHCALLGITEEQLANQVRLMPYSLTPGM